MDPDAVSDDGLPALPKAKGVAKSLSSAQPGQILMVDWSGAVVEPKTFAWHRVLLVGTGLAGFSLLAGVSLLLLGPGAALLAPLVALLGFLASWQLP